MAAERNPQRWEVVQGQRYPSPWRFDSFVNRAAGIARYRMRQDVIDMKYEVIAELDRQRRERIEWITQMLFVAMVSGFVGAALYRLFHLH